MHLQRHQAQQQSKRQLFSHSENVSTIVNIVDFLLFCYVILYTKSTTIMEQMGLKNHCIRLKVDQ